MTENKRRPAIETLSDAPPAPSPQDAPAPPEPVAGPPPPAARSLLGFWARLAFWTVGVLAPLVISLMVYDMAASWIERLPWLGWTLGVLAAMAAIALVMLAIGELWALARLRRIGEIRAATEIARAELAAGRGEDTARHAIRRIEALYAGRADLAWARKRLAERGDGPMDAATRLDLIERELLGPLDAAAREAVAQSSGRVAAATTVMPSALLDAAAALYFNLAMIRRIARTYGGRAGALGSLGLARRVVAHAMAAGLIALGDDLLEPLIGGGVASRLSRRVGEGVVNGAMTARIGLAAMDVCRPAPFHALARPKLREVAWRALRGAPSSAAP